MADARFDAVPADRRETARAALASAFGAAPLGPLAPIAGGASALTYRVEAGGRPYALRLEQARLARRNPQDLTGLRLAAEAGIAPALRYAGVCG